MNPREGRNHSASDFPCFGCTGRGFLVLAAVLPLFCAAPAHAKDIEKIRFRYEHSKIVTEQPYPVDVGELRVNVEYFYRTADKGWSHSGRLDDRARLLQHFFELSIATGVTDYAHVGLQIGYAILEDRERMPSKAEGFVPSGIEGKILLYENKDEYLGIGYLPAVLFALDSVEDEQIATNPQFAAFENIIAVVKDWSDYWTTNADLGYVFYFGENAGRSNGLIIADAAVGYHVTPWLQPVFEINYRRDLLRSEGDEERLSLLGGVVMPFGDSYRFEAGYQQDVFGRNVAALSSFTANFTVTF